MRPGNNRQPAPQQVPQHHRQQLQQQVPQPHRQPAPQLLQPKVVAYHVQSAPAPAAAAPPPPPQEAPLPAGWKSTLDKASGKTYYYNKKEGKTTWERPTIDESESVLPPPPPSVSPAQAAAAPATLAPRKPQKVSGKAAEEAKMIYQCLTEGLEAQRARLVERVKERFVAGDKMAALELNIEKKHVQATLDWVVERRDKGYAAPHHKIAKRKVLLPDINTEIPDGKLQVTIVDAAKLPLTGKGPTHVRVYLPFPRDTPQEQRTPKSDEFKPKPLNDADPAFATTLAFDLVRTQNLIRYAERKHVRLSVEVYHETKVMFMNKKLFVGRAEMDLSGLVSSKEIAPVTLPLMEEKNKKATGGTVTVSAAVRAPWSGDAAKELVEEVIIIDDETAPKPPPAVAAEHQRLLAGSAGVAVPSGLAASVKKPKAAAVDSGGGKGGGPGSVEKANVPQLDKLYQSAKKRFDQGTLRSGMSEEEKEQCKQNTVEAHGIFLQILKLSNGADFRCTKEYVANCKKLISMRGPAVTYNQLSEGEPRIPDVGGGGGDSDSVVREDVVMDEWDAVARIRSYEVLQSELALCDRMAQKLFGASQHAEWEVRKDEVENASQILTANIESGVLSERQYINSLKGALKRDVTIAQELKKQNRAEDFKRVLGWCKIMRDELAEAQGGEEAADPQEQVAPAKQAPPVPVHAPTPADGGSSGGGGARGHDDNDDDVDHIVSYEVVQFELQQCKEGIRKEALQLRSEQIETDIEIGTITEEQYLAGLKKAIAQATQKYAAAAKAGKAAEAKKMSEWVRIMKEEAGMAASADPQPQAPAPAAPQAPARPPPQQAARPPPQPTKSSQSRPPPPGYASPENDDDDFDEDAILAEAEAEEAKQFDRVSAICSRKVLQQEINMCNQKLKENKGKPDFSQWEFRKEELELKLEEVTTNLQCGLIGNKEYAAQLKSAMQRDANLAADLQKQGRGADAARVMSWIKAMKDEFAGK